MVGTHYRMRLAGAVRRLSQTGSAGATPGAADCGVTELRPHLSLIAVLL
jgi:hypothetical protein